MSKKRANRQNLNVNAKIEPILSWSIFTDPDSTGCQKLQIA
jgi:hypothetical protein